MTTTPTAVYDFTNEENSRKWKGVLQPALRKIQKQVHPRMEIDEEAIAYLEELVYHLLSQICGAQPHSISDVKAYVNKNFVSPINTWALDDAKRTMERHQMRRGKSAFTFPVERLYQLLEKEVFHHVVELNVVRYIAAILDYVSADILKLAGNFVKNTRGMAICINTSDIKLSLSADVALHSLFQPLHGQQAVEVVLPPIEAPEESEQATSYDQLVRQLMSNEEKYISHLNLILKVFQEPFLKRPDLFPPKDVEKVFVNLHELYELSVQLLASLDEYMEMAGQVEGLPQCPQAGFVFEELAESEEFEVYINYARNYMDAVTVLENMLNKNTEAVKYLKSLTQPDLFKEAVQYVLPKSLLEPIYHCFYYFEAMNVLMKKSPSEEDQDAYESAFGCMLGVKAELEKECARFLPVRKEEAGMFVQKPNYKTSMRKIASVQSKIEGWEGPDLGQFSTEFVMEGSLLMTREGGRKKTERYVFLLDGLAVCCKPRGVLAMYRLKEKINLRHVKLADLEETESAELKFAFQLIEPDQLAYTFYTLTKPEKNEWMAALTHILTKSTFDRKLNMKLKEEEQEIPVLRPHPDYRFAEDDMDENILFDDREEGKFKSSNEALIKACTIYKLIERLTYHEYADPTLVRTFLMTYRSFCSPTKLLDLLIERFYIPMADDVDEQEAKKDPLMLKAIKAFKANYVSPIQLRVFNVLRHWVESHYHDFQRDPELLTRFRSFIDNVKGKNMQKWITSLNRALQKRADEQPSFSKPVFNRKPDPVEWWLTRKPEEFNLISLHPKEIARQLTLIMAENFRAIHPSELVDASWMKEKKKETASPNLLKHTRFETMVSNWLTKEIVYTENFEERVALVSRLVDIMMELRSLNNFAGMFVVNAAFQSASVFRLTHTFKKLEGRKTQVLEEMKQIASPDRSYKNYKEKLRSIIPPCIPFVGMYLSWIVFIRDGNEDQIPGMPENFINFRKRRKIATVLQEIQQYQNTPYCIEPEPTIQKYILSQDPQGSATANQWEEELFEQSRIVEPKDQMPKKAAKRWKFDLKAPDHGFSGFLTLQMKRPHRQNPSQLLSQAFPDGQQENDTNTVSVHQRSSSSIGSEPSSPSPTFVHSDQGSHPPIPPKPPSEQKASSSSSSDLSKPDLPPRPRPELPPRTKGKVPPPLVSSESSGGFDRQTPSPQPDLRNRSQTLPDFSTGSKYRKPPMPPPSPLNDHTCMSGQGKSPPPPPPTEGGKSPPPPPLPSSESDSRWRSPPPLPPSESGHRRSPPPLPPSESGHRRSPPPLPPLESGGHKRSPPPLPPLQGGGHRRSPPPLPPSETGGHRRSPPPLPPPPLSDTSSPSQLLEDVPHHEYHNSSEPKGYGKSPPPPPPMDTAPTYDRLFTVQGEDNFGAYDRLKPVIVPVECPPRRLPSKPTLEPVPPLPPRSAADTHHGDTPPPPLPPKVPPKGTKPNTMSTPPLPPKGCR